MYCPSCGSEERQRSQFCRACGTDLRAVRTTLETPDAITASAVSAREQISRVMTEKIAQLESADDLKEIAEDVLPQIEKFLESPEERRLPVPPKEITNRLSKPTGHQPPDQLSEAQLVPSSSVGRLPSAGSVTDHTTQHLGHKQRL